MKIKNMRTPNEEGQWGKVKAFFDVDNSGFEMKGFRLVEGINGLFVSMPSRKGTDDEGNDKYHYTHHPAVRGIKNSWEREPNINPNDIYDRVFVNMVLSDIEISFNGLGIITYIDFKLGDFEGENTDLIFSDVSIKGEEHHPMTIVPAIGGEIVILQPNYKILTFSLSSMKYLLNLLLTYLCNSRRYI